MTATMPSSVDLRDCRLYRFWVEHPVTGEEVLGYIGETVRQPVERMMEHLRDQPWFDTVTRWERDPQIFVGKPAVLEAERQAIRAEKPLYNVRENERNEERIPPPLAIRQRRARDAQRNAPRWVHPADRGDLPGPAPDRASPVRQRRSSGWRPWQRRLVGWGSAWLGSTAGVWIAVLHWHLGDRGHPVYTAMIAAGVLVVWVMCGAPFPVGRWQRRARRMRRRLW